jgi:hypothetical protein
LDANNSLILFTARWKVGYDFPLPIPWYRYRPFGRGARTRGRLYGSF